MKYISLCILFSVSSLLVYLLSLSLSLSHTYTHTQSYLIRCTEYIPRFFTIRYFVSCTRSDLCFTARILSRFMQDPGPKHWQALKRLLRYLKRMKDMVLTYSRSQSESINMCIGGKSACCSCWYMCIHFRICLGYAEIGYFGHHIQFYVSNQFDFQSSKRG